PRRRLRLRFALPARRRHRCRHHPHRSGQLQRQLRAPQRRVPRRIRRHPADGSAALPHRRLSSFAPSYMAPPTIRVVAAMIEDQGRYLITQRRPSAVLPKLWEFPGGRVEEGETDEQALTREVMHRLGVSVEVGQLVSFVRHPYDKYTIELHLYE